MPVAFWVLYLSLSKFINIHKVFRAIILITFVLLMLLKEKDRYNKLREKSINNTEFICNND